MRKILHKILLLLNLIFAGALLLSYLSTLISPVHFWPLSFFGLIYPYLLLLNIVFLIIWLIKWKKAIFISLLTILIGLNHLHNYFPMLNSGNKEKKFETEESLKVLSYNVRAFNIYEWLNDPNTNKGIFNFIRSENPDIICLQEFYTSTERNFHPDRIARLFRETPYHHIEYNKKSSDNTGYGIATFSRYPIVNRGLIQFEGSNNQTIFTDIKIKNKVIRIYNNHLQSVNFGSKNYTFIDSLNLKYDEKQLEELQDISYRLKTAFQKRAKQAKMISAHIRSSHYPVISCGDFNDTPVSYAYRKMKNNLKDAYVSQSNEISGKTYLGPLSFRIDYIMYSKHFRALEYEKVKARLSDHYPILAQFSIEK